MDLKQFEMIAQIRINRQSRIRQSAPPRVCTSCELVLRWQIVVFDNTSNIEQTTQGLDTYHHTLVVYTQYFASNNVSKLSFINRPANSTSDGNTHRMSCEFIEKLTLILPADNSASVGKLLSLILHLSHLSLVHSWIHRQRQATKARATSTKLNASPLKHSLGSTYPEFLNVSLTNTSISSPG
jgi:hypothetical protein